MANASILGVLIVVAIIGASFGSYYLTASPLQSKVASYQSEISSMSANPSTATITRTSTVTSISTTTSTTTAMTTAFYYPVPYNVTVNIVPSGPFLDFAINATYGTLCDCNYYVSGSLSSEQQFPVTPVFQDEIITIGIALECSGNNDTIGSATLYVNNSLVALTNVACGGIANGQISYVL